MEWEVLLHEAFADELAGYDIAMIEALRAYIVLLRQFGPQLGRPHADTLNGSKHANMKNCGSRLPTVSGV